MRGPTVAALEALKVAMETTTPLCLNDDRFIDDNTNPDHVRELCDLCPLRHACRAFAATERPTGGIWAGQRWGTPNTKKRPSETEGTTP